MDVHLYQRDMYGFDFPDPTSETLGIPEGLLAIEGFARGVCETMGERSKEATALLPK